MNINSILQFVGAGGMTAADVGRGYAPDHVKDKAGWGRKIVNKLIGAGHVARGADGELIVKRAGLNVAQQLYQAILADADLTRSYKAPHAPRGTPPRPHHPRASRTPRLFHV